MNPQKAITHQIIKMLILAILLIAGVAAYIKMNHDYEKNFLEQVGE